MAEKAHLLRATLELAYSSTVWAVATMNAAAARIAAARAILFDELSDVANELG
jgi:hypothetical protein